MASSVRSTARSIGHTALHLGRLLVYVAIVLAVIFGIFGVPGGFGVQYDGVFAGSASEPTAAEWNESKVEEIFIDKLNDRRRLEGKQLVSQRDVLTEMGESHSENMAKHGYVGHIEPDGSAPKHRFDKRGLLPECKLQTKDNRYYKGAENAARTSVGVPVKAPDGDGSVTIETERELADHLYRLWLNSPPHRKAMMLYSADEVGLGLAFDGDKVYASLEMC